MRQDIPLTSSGNPTMAEKRDVFKSVQSGSILPQFRKRDWLCLLLAVTFLYNPFLAASLSSNGLNVCHLPSDGGMLRAP